MWIGQLYRLRTTDGTHGGRRAGHDDGPGCGPSPTLNSGELLGGKRAITIEHEGTQYVLRATRNGKLILTK